MRKKNKSNDRYWAIIPAAGIGQRMSKRAQPKQYYLIGNKSIIEHTLQPFLDCPYFTHVIVPLHPKDTHFKSLSIASNSKIHTIEGGPTRAGSVINALNTLKLMGVQPEDWVLTHDAARPFLTLSKLTRFIKLIQKEKVGGIMAIPTRNTLKRVLHDRVTETIPRQNVWQAQTPQMFRYEYLHQALKKIKTEVSDEANAIEQLGHHPTVIPGDLFNIKVTYQEDIAIIRQLLECRYA